MRNTKTHQRGFTMIELLVVLVILGLLAGLVGPRMFGKVDSAKVKTAETQLKLLKSSLQTYRLDMGEYPSTQEGLAALARSPDNSRAQQNWKGPYLDEEIPADPWGNAYQYRREKNGMQDFTLYSQGADGKQGGEELDADIGLAK
ncbi:type II secretion system protein GspG [Cellvibrio sp. KY-GH-1]|uniref:type II secretion system major pseudopilin GspG n=1 Tax=Cellvibrio sp. KY-GH-1 TaxID=2303332 RepID=UPI001248E281|nr:type II secretion system major pseudopilin GspG [Cellvibrio sp. KY-GH-1]QEY17341.1 type II secretion system protein GspG [Cellvibrio sp. KY-GH-1]